MNSIAKAIQENIPPLPSMYPTAISATAWADMKRAELEHAPAVFLPRWNRQQVEAAAEAAGVGCFKWNSMGGGCYVFPLRFGYQGNANTAAAEAAANSLKSAGYEAFVYYQMD